MSKTLQLYNGYKIPFVGFETYECSRYEGGAQSDIEDAIDAGYRHFECACLHHNKEEFGRAIRNKITEEVVKREDLFITSKLWNYSPGKDTVVPMLKDSLNRFNLDYIDLYLVHWPLRFKESASYRPVGEGTPGYSDVDYLETWQGMEECAELRLTKSIGVYNIDAEQMERLLKNCKIKPAVSQIGLNPNLNQKKHIQFCKEHDIIVTAYCSFGRCKYAGFPEHMIFDLKVAEIAKKTQ